jgi:hypothetical protein
VKKQKNSNRETKISTKTPHSKANINTMCINIQTIETYQNNQKIQQTMKERKNQGRKWVKV